jgi:non-ribosomal peptide synthetase component E (peptide arylation enzyme)
MIIVIAISIILVVALLAFRRGSTPPVEMFGQIRSEILDLQRIASANILSLKQAEKLTGFDQDQMLRQSRHVAETIRYVYTIEEAENGLIHTISSQMLKRKNEKYQVQCMLIAMLTLNQSLEAAGIDPKTVEFNIDRSVTGTHYLEMLISQSKHDQMMANNRVALTSGDKSRE